MTLEQAILDAFEALHWKDVTKNLNPVPYTTQSHEVQIIAHFVRTNLRAKGIMYEPIDTEYEAQKIGNRNLDTLRRSRIRTVNGSS